MTETHIHNLHLYNGDCMIGMAQYPDNYFDLAIVDPPYNITSWSSTGAQSISESEIHKLKAWDKMPKQDYFDQLFRASKNQIIWGANHFLDYLGKATTFIVWDKKNRGVHFSDAELAWTSFKAGKVTIFDNYKRINGDKIHPTQKPIALYEWLLHNYAKPEFRILDTHLGSGSHAIAAHYFKIKEFVGYELDKDYYDAACKRIKEQTRQLELFK